MEADSRTLRFAACDEPPFMPGGALERMNFLRSPEALPLVAPVPGVHGDYYGHARSEDAVLPGPFASCEVSYSLDNQP